MESPTEQLISFSKKKLISLCKERDISGISKLNRFELIALLSIDSEVIAEPTVEPTIKPTVEPTVEDMSNFIINLLISFFTINIIFTSIYVYMRF